ncbi:invasion associated locus B family protein [Thetidibacter halocola]|uniref:Invasion associated locus B family protein n=1 Tax=Thetidibacter halocola TaxID=2827239 RepID=A0A8J8B6P2_9RHOB|nr:invasion associated locus B family protein [Thetidibacter halocola]MBS0122854.1 invasion associated locus B family protein [Thetidibacter halocola]
MKHSLTLLTTIAALAAAPALWAQETAPADPAQPAAEAPADSTGIEGTPGGTLDVGEEVANPNQPRTYIKETFNDWSLQCLQVQENPEVCQMSQLLKEPNGGGVAEVSILRVQDAGQAVAQGTFIVPLETLLSAKLTIQVDNGPARRWDYTYCDQIGCYAIVGFTAEDIDRFKRGAKAQITLIPVRAPDQRVVVDMPLSGFTAAYDSVTAITQ